MPGFQACPGAEVAAVCDTDLARARCVAEEFRIAEVYPSVDAMLAGTSLDLVGVVTPDDCHRPAVEAAIAAGAHVLCEKPLATTLADARAMLRLAETADVRAGIGFALRYAPAMLRLREAVAGGVIGEPQLFQAFQQNGQFLDPHAPRHWKMERQRTGGGAIVEYGIHTLDLARWIMGGIA
ncbi:MAG TPA: Gfo/Idh/MocA family oxidoreductase, partial [Gemmatimonadales bacterium]|nr:Gfo/Idh/MocA family oxidoreductase [Gemmatimonadales bacterium]